MTLKKKQVALLELIRAHGPISCRRITTHVHGDDSRVHRVMVGRQMRNLSRRGLIRPVEIGAPENGPRGVRPLLWRAVEVQE